MLKHITMNLKLHSFSKTFIFLSIIIIASFSVAGIIHAGNITAPVGAASVTGYTLGDIFKKITTNVGSTLGSHAFSPNTTPKSTYNSITDVYNAIPTIYPGDFLASSTYFGVTGSIVVRTGDTAVVTTATSSNTFLLTPPAGYYNGSVTVSTTNSDFNPANVKENVTIFGITGTYDGSGGPTILNKQLLKTGQTTCYDGAGSIITCAGTKQDGDLQKGVARSYTDNGNGTISDNATGLMWQKCDVGLSGNDCLTGTATLMNFATATSTCAGLSLGGFSNWRIPNVKELWTIVDYGTFNPSINVTYFPNTPYDWGTWSSTVFRLQRSSYLVDFSDGVNSWTGFSFTRYLRCVRTQASPPSSATAQVGQTGQTVCYNNASPYIEIACSGTKEDAETLDGAARSYTDNGNLTITDNTTGLMWQKCAMGRIGLLCYDDDPNYSFPANWNAALAVCAATSTGGHSDWRLPNISELLTIADYSNPTGESNQTYFPYSNSGNFMTSTSDASSPLAVLKIAAGFVSTVNKIFLPNIRCVRG